MLVLCPKPHSTMKKKDHSPEQIITKLRKVEALTAQGQTIRQPTANGGCDSLEGEQAAAGIVVCRLKDGFRFQRSADEADKAVVLIVEAVSGVVAPCAVVEAARVFGVGAGTFGYVVSHRIARKGVKRKREGRSVEAPPRSPQQ